MTKDKKKTQTSSPKQALFLDQRSLPMALGPQPALVAQAMFHLLLPVLIGLLEKPNYNIYSAITIFYYNLITGCPPLGLTFCMEIAAHKISHCSNFDYG